MFNKGNLFLNRQLNMIKTNGEFESIDGLIQKIFPEFDSARGKESVLRY